MIPMSIANKFSYNRFSISLSIQQQQQQQIHFYILTIFFFFFFRNLIEAILFQHKSKAKEYEQKNKVKTPSVVKFFISLLLSIVARLFTSVGCCCCCCY